MSMQLKLMIFSWNMYNTKILHIPPIDENIEILVLCLQESFISPIIVFNKTQAFKKIKMHKMGGLRSIIFVRNVFFQIKIKILNVPLGSCYFINKGAHFIKIYAFNYAPFAIINLHLVHKLTDNENRKKSLTFLLKNFNKENILKVLCGDYNFRNLNEEKLLISNEFIETKPDIFTYKYVIKSNQLQKNSQFFTDRIFYLKDHNVNLEKFMCLNNHFYWFSDHRPVVALLTVNIKLIYEMQSFSCKDSLNLKLLDWYGTLQNAIYDFPIFVYISCGIVFFFIILCLYFYFML
ncbi:hypothetical protein CDIK_2265 [Cucumispora dikerogammari]|nr:hypothetical protein CDIK_2265 [Cucumispora dikerogammari]